MPLRAPTFGGKIVLWMAVVLVLALGVLLLAVFAVQNVHAQEDQEEDEKPM